MSLEATTQGVRVQIKTTKMPIFSTISGIPWSSYPFRGILSFHEVIVKVSPPTCVCGPRNG